MKNRFVGIIKVTFPDGYEETCGVRERASKGEAHFINIVQQNMEEILAAIESGNVKVSYKGDFSRQIYEGLLKAGADKEKLSIKINKRG